MAKQHSAEDDFVYVIKSYLFLIVLLPPWNLTVFSRRVNLIWFLFSRLSCSSFILSHWILDRFWEALWLNETNERMKPVVINQPRSWVGILKIEHRRYIWNIIINSTLFMTSNYAVEYRHYLYCNNAVWEFWMYKY